MNDIIIKTAKELKEKKANQLKIICNDIDEATKELLIFVTMLSIVTENEYESEKVDFIMGNLEKNILLMKKHIAFYRKIKRNKLHR